MDDILDSLISKLMSLKYKNNGDTFQYSVISGKHENIIKTAIVEWYNMYFGTEYARKIGKLEAKVYAYEQIIANSNFAPVIKYVPESGNAAQGVNNDNICSN